MCVWVWVRSRLRRSAGPLHNTSRGFAPRELALGLLAWGVFAFVGVFLCGVLRRMQRNGAVCCTAKLVSQEHHKAHWMLDTWVLTGEFKLVRARDLLKKHPGDESCP